MITKVALVVVALAAVVLGIEMVSVKHNADANHERDVANIVSLSNQWSETSRTLEEQKTVNTTLQKDMEERKTDIAKLSNSLSEVSENLTKSQADLRLASDDVAKQKVRIDDLEKENDQYDKQSTELKGQLAKLEDQISDTQKKLSASEGDKAELEKELHRLMEEKATLEAQFNNIAALKEQVHKLQQAMNEALRLRWMHEGVFAAADQKGSQRLMQNSTPGSTRPATPNNYDLNVEVKSDGSTAVLPPITNSPSSDPHQP